MFTHLLEELNKGWYGGIIIMRTYHMVKAVYLLISLFLMQLYVE